MSLNVHPVTRSGWRRKARYGAISGLAGGLAFASSMELDLRLTRYPADDYLLLGGMVCRGTVGARPIGMAMHLANSAAVGAIYGITAAEVTALPGAVKGTIFAMIEHGLLFPLFLFEARHPLIKSGKLPSYCSWIAFMQETTRHLAFGFVTGAIYQKLVRSQALS